MLTQKDLRRRSGKTNLSMMKGLIKEATRGAVTIFGRPELKRHRIWTTIKALDFYEGVRHLFEFPGNIMRNGLAKKKKA